ncbi:MAG TPA: metallophosphoesterase [Bacteroidota bacterium]|jgi:hypothetical protein|nr:metallophosphoesterase [Bacteroidota bacterium]
MKILALTDIHGAYGRAAEIIKKESADVVIIGGDLTTLGSVREAGEAIRRFQEYSPCVLCVAGNMDSPQHDDLFVRLNVSINGRGAVIDKIGFFGASAAPHSPLHTPYEISEEELSARILQGYNQVRDAARKVFVPHAPPYGTKVDIVHSGIHVGSTAVRDFIEDAEPDIVVCGHIHEGRGQDAIGKSRIVNCGATANGYYAVLMLEESIAVKSERLIYYDSRPEL